MVRSLVILAIGLTSSIFCELYILPDVSATTHALAVNGFAETDDVLKNMEKSIIVINNKRNN
jgi:hypothetical protein